jgi:hypothetical protein
VLLPNARDIPSNPAGWNSPYLMDTMIGSVIITTPIMKNPAEYFKLPCWIKIKLYRTHWYVYYIKVNAHIKINYFIKPVRPQTVFLEKYWFSMRRSPGFFVLLFLDVLTYIKYVC